jgi:arylsulfatase A-like enzyme
LNVFGRELLLKRYQEEYPKGLPNLTKYNGYFRVEDVFEGIAGQLEGLQDPFLCYLHFYPPHEPYLPRREFIGIFNETLTKPAKPKHFFSEGLDDDLQNWARQGYDEFIAQVDTEFGQLYDRLSSLGRLEDSYIIITTDHGQLFERGVHGHDTPLLYEPLIHAPLLIHRPGQTQHEDVFHPTSAVDLLPTLLQAIGKTIPDWCDGAPLLGGQELQDRPIYVVEAKTNSSFAPLKTCTLALIRYPYKLIAYLGYQGYDQQYELYRLDEDPEELEDLSVSQNGILQELKAELHAQLARVNQPYLTKG